METVFRSTIAFATALAALTTAAAESPTEAAPAVAGTLTAPPRNETSGLTTSHRSPDLLWLLEDSGGKPRLYAVSNTGELRGTLLILGTANTDWEGLASFEREGKSWLLVADTGDNDARREHTWLHLIEEPDPAHLSPQGDLSARPARSLRVRYEDGPHDCEGVAVNPADGMVYLLTKREAPPRLYRVPWDATDRIAVAKFVGSVPHAAVPILPGVPLAQLFGRMRGFICGLDFAPDGTAAVVLTYADTWLYPRDAGETWPEALSRTPIRLAPHQLPQAEAVGFSRDGRSIFVASESSRTLLRYARE